MLKLRSQSFLYVFIFSERCELKEPAVYTLCGNAFVWSIIWIFCLQTMEGAGLHGVCLKEEQDGLA